MQVLLAPAQQLAALKSEPVQTKGRISALETSLQHTHLRVPDGPSHDSPGRKLQTGDPIATTALVGALISE